MRLDPARVAGSAEDVGDGSVELLAHGHLAVLLEDPCLRLDDLGERPEGDAVAVRKTAALAPRDSSGSASAIRDSSWSRRLLPMPRHTDERHELRRTLVAGAVEGISE